MLAKQQSEGSQEWTSEILHVDGAWEGHQRLCRPHSLDVYTSHSFISLSPDLLPSLPFGGEFFPSLSPLSFTLRLSICKQMHAYVSIITSAHSQTSHHHIKALIRNMCPGWRLLRSPKLIPSAEKLMNNKNEKVLILFPQSCQQMWGEKTQPRITSISPLKEWADFAELLEITCWIKSPYYLKNRGPVTETVYYGVPANALCLLNCSCHPA